MRKDINSDLKKSQKSGGWKKESKLKDMILMKKSEFWGKKTVTIFLKLKRLILVLIIFDTIIYITIYNYYYILVSNTYLQLRWLRSIQQKLDLLQVSCFSSHPRRFISSDSRSKTSRVLSSMRLLLRFLWFIRDQCNVCYLRRHCVFILCVDSSINLSSRPAACPVSALRIYKKTSAAVCERHRGPELWTMSSIVSAPRSPTVWQQNNRCPNVASSCGVEALTLGQSLQSALDFGLGQFGALKENENFWVFSHRAAKSLTWVLHVVLFIHLDRIGMSCSVLEISAVEMSAFSIIIYKIKCHLTRGARTAKTHI